MSPRTGTAGPVAKMPLRRQRQSQELRLAERTLSYTPQVFHGAETVKVEFRSDLKVSDHSLEPMPARQFTPCTNIVHALTRFLAD